MTKYRVVAYITASVVKEVEADSEEKALKIAKGLSASPGLCHQCSSAGCDDPECWELNGWDDNAGGILVEGPVEEDA